ncbi:MAG: zinc-binding alcohol dehydrogenase family protein [Elusimicrobiota bacterium]|jgi:L-gulonate 5-dehydrogenase|nr:zinc-binding alcohol dehydrogenase family protein [Elusimicrobiota bacterium]
MKSAKVTQKDVLTIEEVEKPSIQKENEVLIRPKFVGICGSDSHIYHGENPMATLPRILGHEVVGVVEDMGKAVKGLTVGDHIVIEPIRYCGKCYPCRHGQPNVCESLLVFGVREDGGMREYFTIQDKQVLKLDKSLPWEEAILIEPFTIGAQATMRGSVGVGDTVLIIGAGPIGIATLKLAKIKGAAVMVTDVIDEKLDFAKKQGADIVVNSKTENLEQALKDWTKGEMANKVIDAACTIGTFELCLKLVSIGGTIVVLGFSTDFAKISPVSITGRQITLIGSRLQAYQFANVLRLMESGALRGNGLVTHKFKFADIQKAFDLIDAHPEQVKKALLEFF